MLCQVFVAAHGISLASVVRVCAVAAAHGFPIAAASLVAAQGSAVAAHGLSCPAAMWNLPEPGIEPGAPALAGGFFTAGPPEKSLNPAF